MVTLLESSALVSYANVQADGSLLLPGIYAATSLGPTLSET